LVFSSLRGASPGKPGFSLAPGFAATAANIFGISAEPRSFIATAPRAKQSYRDQRGQYYPFRDVAYSEHAGISPQLSSMTSVSRAHAPDFKFPEIASADLPVGEPI
jgi:hypothetical protein